VTAAEVNDYLQEVADAAVTAKDFRTLAASAAAADMLA
jgi:DNA topoisomerase-1